MHLWYSLIVEYEWDPPKAQANLRKHKVSFLIASEYGEERWIVIGRVEQMILFVVYTQRGQRTRLISARRATHYEQRNYWLGDIQA